MGGLFPSGESRLVLVLREVLARTNSFAPRIVMMIYSLAGGGAEAAAISLIRGWDALGVGTDLVLAANTGHAAVGLPASCRVTVLGCANAQRWVHRTAQLLRRRRPSTVLTFMEGAGLTALIARSLARTNTKVIVSVHNNLPVHLRSSSSWKERLLAPSLVRTLYPRADGVVAVSAGVAADLATYVDVPQRRIRVIYNPIVGEHQASVAAEDSAHPWFNDRHIPVILAAGRLAKQKDYPTLLRAFRRAREHTDARLIVLGEGPERQALEACADQLGVADNTAFVGFVTDPRAYMRRASLLALSSAWEGFGNVLVEAMACGTPVVSTDCPHGPREILDGGRYGALVPVGDHQALADAILTRLGGVSDAERSMLVERAAEFSVERAATQYLDVLGIHRDGLPS